MSNHFTGLSLGPPLGDQRLDLCDLYAFQSPTNRSRTVIILNANPNADALHPDAIYRSNSKSTKFLGFANQQKSDSGLGCSSCPPFLPA